MLAQLREDVGDHLSLAAEMIRVAVRLNPVNQLIHHFIGIISQIPDNAPRAEVASLVQSAMCAVDLTNAVIQLDDALEHVTGIGPNIVNGHTAELLAAWPEARHLVRHSWVENAQRASEDIRQQLRRTVRAHRQDLSVIQNHFRQLQEFHPRYHAIMTRNEWWDYVLGFAAGFFGGHLGMMGAGAWDNWRNKSDGEFVQSFGCAVDQFCGSMLAFTQKTEQEVESILPSFLNELRDFHNSATAALEEKLTAMDLTPIYHKLHYPTERLDADTLQFFEIVLANLREQRISARSEANIREMLGIR